jgi:hypothetical protein
MSYQVSITDTATGENKMVTMDLPWLEHSRFWWTDGNFGCDCNRSSVFDPSRDEPCGSNGSSQRYVVHYALFDDGSMIAIDDETEDEYSDPQLLKLQIPN